MNKISLRKFRDLKFLSSHFSSGLAIYYVSTCLSTERECNSRRGCQKLLKPKDISFKIFLYVWVFWLQMHDATCVQFSQRPEEGIESLRTEVMDDCVTWVMGT